MCISIFYASILFAEAGMRYANLIIPQYCYIIRISRTERLKLTTLLFHQYDFNSSYNTCPARFPTYFADESREHLSTSKLSFPAIFTEYLIEFHRVLKLAADIHAYRDSEKHLSPRAGA